MAVTGPTSTLPPTSTTGSNSMQQLSGNFSTFLTLLTTQLQNQDPMSPMDSNQFTQQLVQYSQVEQQISSNENLKTLIAQANARRRPPKTRAVPLTEDRAVPGHGPRSTSGLLAAGAQGCY